MHPLANYCSVGVNSPGWGDYTLGKNDKKISAWLLQVILRITHHGLVFAAHYSDITMLIQLLQFLFCLGI